MPLPGFSALEAFLAVARHNSFRKAALERGVSPSALSHVIRGLEDTLGVRLFNRTNRSIRITAAGQHLLERIRPALGDITEAIRHVSASGARPAGTLRLNVPRSAAELVIRPGMARFLAAYPGVRLDVTCNDGLVDIVAGGFDAGIRAGHDLAQDMVAVPVGPPLGFAVVGAPSYFARHGTPGIPHDLYAHACVERRYPSGARYPWRFARDGEAVEVAVSGPLVTDDRALTVAAALDGVGLAHIHAGLVADHVACGALVGVLGDWCPVLPPFSLYYPGRRQVPPPLRAFIGVFRAGPELGADPNLTGKRNLSPPES